MSNVTISGPGIEKDARVEIFSAETTRKILMVMKLIVFPTVSLLGIVGNSFSIVILFKHGLRKSSNILLFALAVADLTTLLANFDIPQWVYEHHGQNSFRFSQSASRVWFVFYKIIKFFSYAPNYVSLWMPVLITVERLFAVFLPLRFSLIVTPLRTWVAVAMVRTLYVSYYIHDAIVLNCLYFVYNRRLNMYVGKIFYCMSYARNFMFYAELRFGIIILMGTFIPPGITALGCIIISIKITINSLKRKKLTRSASLKSNLQMTKIMLAVCSVYIITCCFPISTGFNSVNALIMYKGFFTNFGLVFIAIGNLCSYINNSFNFIVYVGMNKKFRDSLKSLLSCPRSKQQ